MLNKTIVMLLNTVSAELGQDQPVKNPFPIFNVKPAIKEVSSAVKDKIRQVIWTVGDSGTGPYMGRTNLSTFKTERIEVLGVVNRDWEALVLDSRGHVWLLDVGNNFFNHNPVKAHQINPDNIKVRTIDGVDSLVVTPDRTVILRYPKKFAVDCEAAIVKDDRLYLIQKSFFWHNPKVYSADISPESPNKQTLNLEGSLKNYRGIRKAVITDAGISEDGETVYTLSYGILYKYHNFFKFNKTGYAEHIDTFNFGMSESLTVLGDNRFYIGYENGNFFLREL